MSKEKNLLTELPPYIYKTHIETKLTRGDKTRLLATSKRFTMSPKERTRYKKLLDDLKIWAAKTNKDYENFFTSKNLRLTGRILDLKIGTRRLYEYEHDIIHPFLYELSPEDNRRFVQLYSPVLNIHKVVDIIHNHNPFEMKDISKYISIFNDMILSITNKDFRSILAVAYMATLKELQEEYKLLDREDDILKIIAYELNARIVLSDYSDYEEQVKELANLFENKLQLIRFERSKNKELIEYIRDILKTKPHRVTDPFIKLIKDTFIKKTI